MKGLKNEKIKPISDRKQQLAAVVVIWLISDEMVTSIGGGGCACWVVSFKSLRFSCDVLAG